MGKQLFAPAAPVVYGRVVFFPNFINYCDMLVTKCFVKRTFSNQSKYILLEFQLSVNSVFIFIAPSTNYEKKKGANIKFSKTTYKQKFT